MTFEEYKMLPKWKGKIFMKDEETCFNDGFEAGAKELQEENDKLKKEKIPQLEHKIASIRGAHSVDCKKLNARIEQVERLKEENERLNAKLDEVKGIIKTGLEGIKREFVVAGNVQPYREEAIKLCNEYCERAEAFLKEE